MGKQLTRRTALDHQAAVQHADFIAQVVHYREVVADQQITDAELLLQVLHQVEHLRLHRHIERAHRLVGHDQLGSRDERPRNGDALALATGKLVRVLVEIGAAQAHRCQRFGRSVALRLATAALGRVGQRFQRFGHDARDRLARIERTVRILKHHLDVAPGGTQLIAWQPVQVAAQQFDTARSRHIERHHQARDRRLARARFANDAQAASGLDRKAHAVQRLDQRRC